MKINSQQMCRLFAMALWLFVLLNARIGLSAEGGEAIDEHKARIILEKYRRQQPITAEEKEYLDRGPQGPGRGNAKRPPPVIKETLPRDEWVRHVVKRHPRVLATAADFDRAKELIKTGTDRQAAALYRNLKRQAEGFLQSPLPTPPASYQTDFNMRRRMHSLALYVSPAR